MKAFLEHISFNVSNPKVSLPFYKELLEYFGYTIIEDKEDSLAARKDGSPDFWISPTDSKYLSNSFHRKNTGLNHLAFHVSSKEDVDSFYEEYLQPRGIKPLYNSPRTFPEYTDDYYAVYFEDPDRIKLEVNSFEIK
jgi:catechol 2,3-dioxygenase-like lactoylglutathione lyase family enzyme